MNMYLRLGIPNLCVLALVAVATACGSSAGPTRADLSVNEPGVEPQAVPASSVNESPIVHALGASHGPRATSATASAQSAAPAGAINEYGPNGDPLTYYGGAVMKVADVYFIWYGNWTNSTTPAILGDLVKGLNASPYNNILTTYYDGSGSHPFNTVRLGQSVNDPGSRGTNLHQSDIYAIAEAQIGKNLPFDANGIYIVATSSNVTITDPGTALGNFCTTTTFNGKTVQPYCGWHGPQTVNSSVISVILAPDGTQCPSECPIASPSPNGNGAADEMASVVAHEIMESVTDLSLNAWHDDTKPNSNENGDECAWLFGTQQYAAPGCGSTPCANVHLGSRDFLIQMDVTNLGSKKQFCAIHYYRNNDVVWRNSTTGDVAVQWGDGSPNPSFAYAANGVPLEWSLVGRGDFDGDAYGDFLWRDTRTGDVVIWTMQGKTATGAATVYPGLSSVWQTIGTGDFDGDGQSDIAWRNNSTGDVVFWFMNGTTIASAPTVAAGLALQWVGVATGDFNGDGKSDILWRNTSTGDVYMWLMNGTQSIGGGTVKAGLNVNWVTLGTGDFNGDGETDILWQNVATKDVAVWIQNGATTIGTGTLKSAFTGYELIGIGDFNGDGTADVMWRNTSSSAVVTWRLASGGSSIASTLATMSSSNPGLVSNGTFGDQF